MRRQLLIEKYINPNEIILAKEEGTGILCISLCWYNKHGEFNSRNGQPSIKTYMNGKTTTEAWYKNNKIHREKNMPARIWYCKDGTVFYKQWWKHGKFIKREYTKLFREFV